MRPFLLMNDTLLLMQTMVNVVILKISPTVPSTLLYSGLWSWLPQPTGTWTTSSPLPCPGSPHVSGKYSRSSQPRYSRSSHPNITGHIIPAIPCHMTPDIRGHVTLNIPDHRTPNIPGHLTLTFPRWNLNNLSRSLNLPKPGLNWAPA